MKQTALSRLLAAALLATLALSGAASGQDAKAQPAKPKLAIQNPEHNFGEIKKGSTAQHSFTVKNEGGADLEIKNVVPACGCTASDFTKIIPPGKEGKITLTFNSAGFNGAIAKRADVYTNDPERPQLSLMISMIIAGEDALRGSKVGPFVIGPSNEWSGRAAKGSSASGMVTITNTSQGPVNITKLDPNGTAFNANLQTLEAGKRYSVGFTTSATLALGLHKQTIKLTTDSKETPELELRLEVVVTPAVTISPASLTFNNLPVSTADSEAALLNKFIWVRSGLGAGLEIKSITSDLPFIKASVETTEGGSITIRVGFSEKPPVGTHTGKIKIETNNPDAKIIEAPITVQAK